MTSYPPPPPGPDDGSAEPAGYPPPAPAYPQTAGMPTYPIGAEGGLPAYPPDLGGGEPPAERPVAIARAVLLMRAGAVLSALTIIVNLLTLNSIKDNIRTRLLSSGDYTQADFDSAYHRVVVSTIVVGVVAIAVWLWMAQVNGSGRKWARVVASVLGGFSILSFIATVAVNQQTALVYLLAGLTALVALVILFLLYRPESTAYYQAKSRRDYS